ncbi:MAG: PAS domain S-box protein, partial [Bacteroidota bacterium]
MINLNKILPWLSIRSKLIIAFAGLSIIPVGLVGLHGIYSNVRMMKQIAFENLTHDVQTIREKTANFLTNVESDLHLLRNSSSLARLVNGLEKSPGGVPESEIRHIGAELLAFSRTKAIYYQIRIVDDLGNELIRVECINSSDSLRSFRSVPAAELHQRTESYYFLLVSGNGQDEISFEPAELVNEHNERIPVITFAMPLRTGTAEVGLPKSRGRGGILIANVFAKDHFRIMEIKRHLNVEGKVVLVSSDGYYLYHSEKKKDWNRLLASREEDNLQNEYPPTVAAMVLSGNEGILTNGLNDIISYAPLFSTRTVSYEEKSAAGSMVPLYVFESVPKDLVLGSVRSFAWTFAGFLVLFLAGAIGLGLLATRQFTQPIAELHQGAAIIARGNYGHRLQVQTHDEIEKLAAQFNSMASSLEAHEREIQRHRTNLEEMVSLRTRELTDEKTKLQAILDNVPSAFVLLDKDFRIQTASAAFAAVTGLRLEDVRGKDCREMFCGNGFCQQCVSRLAMLSGQIETHIDKVTDRKLADRFIEHTAIPMNSDGEGNAILEIITDITKRKQFEQRLVRTERLMAAGEMSALIAHEFRNSLTSIKMILQLQKESKRFSRSDKKSLGVALNSIYHMERVVMELLNFARPYPMEFRTEELSDIINESLTFVQLHINKQRIRL